MPELNASIPRFTALLRKHYLYQRQEHVGEYEECVVFGVSSIPGRAVGWHVMTRCGAVVSRLPISALCWKPCDELTTQTLELWDAFSYHVTVTEYDFLAGMRCEVKLPEDKLPRLGPVSGTYMFTLDWHSSPESEDVGDLGWKSAHVIRCDPGFFVAQPNNRVLWREPAWVEPRGVPDYKIINYIERCEQGGRTGEGMFYEVER